jgi:hypothetical protein
MRSGCRILVGKPEGKRRIESLMFDVSVLLKYVFKKQGGRVGWIYLAQDRDRWRTLVNAVTNRCFP